MRTAYICTISIAIMLSIIIIRKFATEKKYTFVKWLRRVLIAAATAEVANLFIALSRNTMEAELSYALYYISIDWTLFFLVVFVRDYVKGEENKFKKSQLIIYFIINCLDSLSLMVNGTTHHAFTVSQTEWGINKELYYMSSGKIFFQMHLVLSYLALVTIFTILIREFFKSVSFYRVKYAAIFIIIFFIVVLNAVYLFFDLPLDWSVILYSIACVFLEHYATGYTPRHLMISALSETVYKLGEGLILFDINDECMYANKMVEDLFAVKAETITVDSAPVKEWLQGRTLQNAYPIDTYYDIASTREYIRYRLRLKQIISKKGDYIGSYFQVEDVTKEYRAMMEIQESRKKEELARIEASRANRAKSDFLANMSHEIRTPINAVLGMNEMILRENVSPEVREYAKNIALSGEALLSLVNDILDFSKIESGKMELTLGEYEPFAIIKACETMVGPRIAGKKLKFIVECDEKCPKKLYGDEARIRQILTNVLTNAAKYTEEGSVTLTLKWESKRMRDGNLVLTVADTGIGIARENQSKLFDAFKRLDEKRNRNIEGTGLGLSITSQLLKLMNGHISVESEYGKGSTFTITIPQGIIDSEESGRYGQSEHEETTVYQELFKAPDAKILAVDDYKMNLTVLKGLLKKTQVRLTTACSGAEALEKASAEKFHLILMDHMMPGMDGIETLQKIRSEEGPNKETPVIMLTANAVTGVEEQYLKAGFQGYLSKPINSKALESELHKFIPDELILKE